MARHPADRQSHFTRKSLAWPAWSAERESQLETLRQVAQTQLESVHPRHDHSLHELEIHDICDVIRAYVARLVDLEGDKRMRYVLIFKNHGEQAGAHTHQSFNLSVDGPVRNAA
jgi:galactose-1-phosphate uridylyltransferase